VNRGEEVRDFYERMLSGPPHDSGRTPRPLREPRTLAEPSSI